MPHMPSQQQDFSPRADTAQSKLPAELTAARAQRERQRLQFPSQGAADSKDLSLSCLKAFCSFGLANQVWCVGLQGVLEKRTRLVYSWEFPAICQEQEVATRYWQKPLCSAQMRKWLLLHAWGEPRAPSQQPKSPASKARLHHIPPPVLSIAGATAASATSKFWQHHNHRIQLRSIWGSTPQEYSQSGNTTALR